MIPQIDIAVADNVECDQAALSELARVAIAAAVQTAEPNMPENSELSVYLADDMVLQKLNKEWREKDSPTNVLSFPTRELIVGECADIMLGDIVISLETAEREAGLENRSFNDHFSHLIIHGFLHLFGYDHEIDKEAETMETLEIKILADIGIANPYEN